MRDARILITGPAGQLARPIAAALAIEPAALAQSSLWLLSLMVLTWVAGFDVIYAWDPDGAWTGRHQMSLNGKRDGFEREDLRALARVAGIKPGPANALIDRVLAAVRRWPGFAERAGVSEAKTEAIRAAHRLDL